MKSYTKSKIWPFNILYMLIGALIAGIFISFRGGWNIISGTLFGLFTVLFIGVVIAGIKLTLYNGQFGVKVEYNPESGTIMIKDNEISISNLKHLSRHDIRYYGSQINLETSENRKFKFFSPESSVFEGDVINDLRKINKNIEIKSKTLPYPGVIYTIG